MIVVVCPVYCLYMFTQFKSIDEVMVEYDKENKVYYT